jgi:hypothetical protein
MGTKSHKVSKMQIVLVCCIGAILLLASCQQWQKGASDKRCSICPTCKTETNVIPVSDLKYTRCICPLCKNVSALDATTLDAVEAYTGVGVGETVHVCDNCKSLVEVCAACRQK